MKSFTLSLLVLLAACSETPKPPPSKPPAQFLWMTVPGTMADADQMGFACQPAPDGVANQCLLNGVDVLGVTVDAVLFVSSQKHGGSYTSIGLIARKPFAWETACPRANDVDIVMLDGSIKKNRPGRCVKDKRDEFEAALSKNGWERTSRKGYVRYTNGNYRVSITHGLDSETFTVSRAD